MSEKLVLHTPTFELASAFLAMNKEYREFEQQETFKAILDLYKDYDNANVENYIQKLIDQSEGLNLKAGHVPATTFWLVSEDNDILAVSRLRHSLTPSLEDMGGHIGYSVRPSRRNKGYGTRLLTSTLERAKTLGLQRVLLTCDKDNTCSTKVILSNGGKLASEGISQTTGEEILRFWIEL
jgi:predicted acetyltransferase